MRLFTYLLCYTLLLVSSSVWAASVWKVSKDGQHFYLAGTVHLLSKNDYPLPAAYDTAFNQSSELLFETDLNALTSPAGLSKMMHQNTYSDGKTLEQVLSAEVYQQLKNYTTERNMPIAAVSRFKPGFAAMMLASVEMQRLGAAETGVDMHYLQLGQQQDKKISGLETTDQHLAVLDGMNLLDPDVIIRSTLQDMPKVEGQLVDMKQAWRSGNTEKLEQLFVEDLQQVPQMYEILLVNRNHAWMPMLQSLTGNEHTTMVLVGALHLAGEDGLLKLLQQQGYTLVQLNE
ncbi:MULTISPECIES: TraB/GumN family protein [unclassified Arsukibacterium]|uniref:TraB/GumN family protein n=1 Tax=unclassified Arsukibacterium TaxID=2635278 RepID=UPI000C94A2AB|nr:MULTISPECIES: TraB/GumN family protein [unclassified Arsukibacterium]MAA94042.1 TraB/GumN family protein [Rheinheimera sp.]HAW93830.1 TraB/GumN family protein [Candidatus Azambacteria bacterium]